MIKTIKSKSQMRAFKTYACLYVDFEDVQNPEKWLQ